MGDGSGREWQLVARQEVYFRSHRGQSRQYQVFT
jgi:hypothetical protein